MIFYISSFFVRCEPEGYEVDELVLDICPLKMIVNNVYILKCLAINYKQIIHTAD